MITIVISLMSLVIQAIVALLSLAVASRYLDASTFSTWALAGASFAYVSLLDIGASVVVQRNLASGQPELMNDGAVLAKTLLLVLGSIGVALFILAEFANVKTYADMIGAMMARVSVNVLGATMVAKGELVLDRICRISSSLILLLVQFCLLHAGVGINAWAPSVMLAAFTYLAIAFALSADVRSIVGRARFSFAIFRKYGKHHVNWLFYTVPGLFIYNFQIFALRIWSTVEAVGVFSAAHQLYFNAISIFSITTILSSVAISKHHYARSERRNELILSNLRTNAMLTTLALAAVTILLKPLGALLFPGIAIHGNWLLFALYGVVLIVEASQMVLTNALISAEVTDFKWVNIASATLNVGACCVLVPKLGVTGAVLSVGFAQLVTCNYFNVRKAIRLLSLSAKTVVVTVGGSILAYALIVLAHWAAHEVPGRVGDLADALIICGIVSFSYFLILPRVLYIVNEYRLSNGR